MSKDEPRRSFVDRVRSWLYDKCFAYCIRYMHPEADPAEFCFLDMTNFIAVSKDELREVMEESPDSAWRFAADLEPV